MTPTREDAWALLTEYTHSDSLRKHALAVESAVRGYAREFGEDESAWGIVGLIHDFDYARVELLKLLRADRPSLGLRPMERTGLWERVLPPLADEERDATIEAVDAIEGDAVVRLARIFYPKRAQPELIDRGTSHPVAWIFSRLE